LRGARASSNLRSKINIMRALSLKRYKELEVTEIPGPVAGPDGVPVAVKACGICGSAVHGYGGGTGRWTPPVVLGHEAAGVVFEVGERVKRFRAGGRVTFGFRLGSRDRLRRGC
jgi:L-iditol 2-dehydrogenase